MRAIPQRESSLADAGTVNEDVSIPGATRIYGAALEGTETGAWPGFFVRIHAAIVGEMSIGLEKGVLRRDALGRQRVSWWGDLRVPDVRFLSTRAAPLIRFAVSNFSGGTRSYTMSVVYDDGLPILEGQIHG